MSDYVQALRSKDETPGSLPAMTKEAESAILDKYKDEVIAAQEGKYAKNSVINLSITTKLSHAGCFE